MRNTVFKAEVVWLLGYWRPQQELQNPKLTALAQKRPRNREGTPGWCLVLRFVFFSNPLDSSAVTFTSVMRTVLQIQGIEAEALLVSV